MAEVENVVSFPVKAEKNRSRVNDEDLLEQIHARYEMADRHLSDWRTEANANYDYVAGNQWAEEDLQKLRDELRPAITFNRIGPVVDAVGGLEIQNRQEVRFIPREQGDVKVNEILTGAAKWCRDNCDAEDEESEAFLDAVICGMGWTETSMDYEVDPDGKPMIERRNPLRMWWDTAAQKPNLADARWVMYIQDMPRDEFEQRFPDADVPTMGPWDREALDLIDPLDATQRDLHPYSDNPNRSKIEDQQKYVRVVRYQWFELEEAYRVLDPQTGTSVMLEARRYRVLEGKIKRMGVRVIKQQRRVYFDAWVTGHEILKRGLAPCETSFTFRAITAKRDQTKGIWYGLVRAMRDPQQWANKFFSQILHIVNRNAKGGAFAEIGAFKDPRRAEEQWSDPGSLILLNDGAVAQGKIQERAITQLPPGLDKMLQFAITSIPDVTGVNLELLGLAGREQAGVLEQQRKQAGLSILARLFNSLRRYRKEQGRVLLYFIQNYLTDGRMVRIIGEEGQQYVRLTKEEGVSTYDVIVDDSPTSPNMREQVWAVLGEMMPVMLKAGVPIPPEILDYSPLPESLAQKWKETLGGQGGEDPRVAQLTQAVQQLEEELKGRKAEKQMELQFKAQMEQQANQIKQALEAMQQQHEDKRLMVETHNENLLQRQQIASDEKIATMKLQVEAQNAERDRQNQKAIAELQARVDTAMAYMKERSSAEQGDKERETKTNIAKMGADTKVKTTKMTKDAGPKKPEPKAKKRKRKFQFKHDKDGNIIGGIIEEDGE